MSRAAAGWVLFLLPAPVWGETPQPIIDGYAAIAKQEDPEFAGFSAERGEKLCHEQGVIPGIGSVSRGSCHLEDPKQKIVAHKSKILCRACHVINDEEHPNPKKAKVREIHPLAPAANHKRLTDRKTVEDFLRVNCILVFKRQCSAREKGDVLLWLSRIK